MNRIIATALVAFAASSAFAESPIGDATPFTATLSRAQVQSELQQFQGSGVNPWAQDYDQLSGARGSKTRAQVVGEFLQSRDEAAALTGEDSGSAFLSVRERSGASVVAGQPANAQ